MKDFTMSELIILENRVLNRLSPAKEGEFSSWYRKHREDFKILADIRIEISER